MIPEKENFNSIYVILYHWKKNMYLTILLLLPVHIPSIYIYLTEEILCHAH